MAIIYCYCYYLCFPDSANIYPTTGTACPCLLWAAPWDLWISLELIPLSGGFLVSVNKQECFPSYPATNSFIESAVKGLFAEDFTLSVFLHFLHFSSFLLYFPLPASDSQNPQERQLLKRLYVLKGPYFFTEILAVFQQRINRTEKGSERKGCRVLLLKLIIPYVWVICCSLRRLKWTLSS